MRVELLIALLALAAILATLHLLDRHLREGGREGRVRGARWARPRDLRPLRVKAPEPGRLTLGRQGRWLLAAEERASVIVFAPTQTYKTSGLVVPALLEWKGPVLATSVKSDLLRDTLAYRRSLGKAMVFDPVGATGEGTVRASPLTGCGTWGGALRVTHWLAGSARRAGGGLEDAGFWYAAAERLIAPLLFAAASGGKTMRDVIRWLNEGEGCQVEVSVLLADTDEDAEGAWKANLNRDERQRSSINTTAETILAAFADPDVLEASLEPDYRPADLLDGSARTLYLCAPEEEQERLSALFATMISEIVAVARGSFEASEKPLDPPLLIALDEAANIAPVPGLAKIAATGSGQGIQLLSVFQDASQVRATYGEQEARTIINNHRGKLIGPGVGDSETLDYVRQVTGSAEFRSLSETSGSGQSSATTGGAYRDLAPANVVREMKPGEAMLVYGHLPAARLVLRPWFGERALKELVEGDGVR